MPEEVTACGLRIGEDGDNIRLLIAGRVMACVSARILRRNFNYLYCYVPAGQMTRTIVDSEMMYLH